ncbi:hypothetical protein FWC31_01715 [Candidatus Saccharibacteria bacterium]|nr:hypothetical protein [Candidatus Saccharibacteria bacterium]
MAASNEMLGAATGGVENTMGGGSSVSEAVGAAATIAAGEQGIENTDYDNAYYDDEYASPTYKSHKRKPQR